MKWLQEIINKAMAWDGQIVDTMETDVKDGEKVLGTLSDPLKKRFCYLKHLSNEINSMMEKHMKKDHKSPEYDESKCPEIHGKLSLLHKERVIIHTVNWIETALELGVLDTVSIGLRKNWQIVQLPDENESKDLPNISVIGISISQREPSLRDVLKSLLQ
jgi:hypothetical protein